MTRQLLAVALDTLYDPGSAMGGDKAQIGTLLTPLINNIFIISGIFAFFTIIFAGFTYITASGDKGKTEQAQHMLNYGILGLVVVVLAFLITRIIGTVFGFKFF